MVVSKERIISYAAILVLSVILYQTCNKEPIVYEKARVVNLYDSTAFKTTLNEPQLTPLASIVDTFLIDSIIYTTDTIKCFVTLKNTLSQLYTEHEYYNVYQDDSIAFLSWRAKVKGNKLTLAEPEFKIRRPTVINEYKPSDRVLLYGGLTLQTTGDVSLNLITELNKGILVGVSYSQKGTIGVSSYLPLIKRKAR